MRGRGESAIDVAYIMMHSITYLSACSFNVIHGFSSSLQRQSSSPVYRCVKPRDEFGWQRARSPSEEKITCAMDSEADAKKRMTRTLPVQLCECRSPPK